MTAETERHPACGRARLAHLWRRESDLRRVVRHPQRRDTGDHRAERRRQDLDAQRRQRLLPPAEGRDPLARPGARAHEALRGRGARHRANVSKRRAVQRHDDARQHHDRPQPADETQPLLASAADRSGARRGNRAPPRSARRSSTSSRSSISARRPSAPCPTACRSASNSAGRSRWSRSSCCSTSRWRA